MLSQEISARSAIDTTEYHMEWDEQLPGVLVSVPKSGTPGGFEALTGETYDCLCDIFPRR